TMRRGVGVRIPQSAIGSPQSAMMSGAIDLRIDAAGSLQHPDLSGMVRITEGRLPVADGHAVTDASLSATYSAGVLTIEQLRAAFEGAALEAFGRIPADLFRDQLPVRWRELVPPAGGPASLDARATSITEQVAAPFLD